jgi:hypothetical protein
MRTGKSLWQASCLMVGILLLAGCPETQPKPVDLNGPLEAKLLGTAPKRIVSLAADKNDNVYAVVFDETGEVMKITPDGKATTITTGLKTNFRSFPAIAVLPNGDLVASDCDDKDRSTIVKIDMAGNKTNLMTLDKGTHVMSITADAAGKVFVGLLKFTGNLSINFQPFNHLAAAEEIIGSVAEMIEDGRLIRLMKTGLPMALTSPEPGTVMAAIWGRSGSFKEENKKYSVCSHAFLFWIVLSDQVEIRSIADRREDSAPLKQLDAVAAIASSGKELLFAAGKTKGEEGSCGIYYVQGKQDPKKLFFSQSGIDQNISALAATASSLFFADVNGNVSRVGLLTAK